MDGNEAGEFKRLCELRDGRRPPDGGEEIRFLKVVRRQADPCCPREHEWLRLFVVRESAPEAELQDRLAQADATLRQNAIDLTNLRSVIQRNEAELARLRAVSAHDKADLARHKEWLEACHETLSGVSPVQKPPATEPDIDWRYEDH